MQQRRQHGKLVLPLQTRGMVFLGTAIGNDSYVKEQHAKWRPKIEEQIIKLRDMTDSLMHARFLKMHLGAQMHVVSLSSPELLKTWDNLDASGMTQEHEKKLH